MRCTCCNRALNDFEATRRTVSTGDFLDMCNQCYSGMEEEIPTVTRPDLNPFDEIADDDLFDENEIDIEEDFRE